MRQLGNTSRLPAEKMEASREIVPAQRPKTIFSRFPEMHTKATANDVRDLSYAEKKGEKIRPVGAISREVMRYSFSRSLKRLT